MNAVFAGAKYHVSTKLCIARHFFGVGQLHYLVPYPILNYMMEVFYYATIF